MAGSAFSAATAVQRLVRDDFTLETISLWDQRLTDGRLTELADCLLTQPDIVVRLLLDDNELTDETGVKLARYIAASSTIQWLNLGSNQLGEATYLALAAALRVNTSLRYLYLFKNQAVDRARIDAAFVEALRLNPHRPVESDWQLYTTDYNDVDYPRLKDEAEQLGHPSLQLLLASLC